MNVTDPTDHHRRRDTERVEMALAAGAIVGTWFWDIANDRVTVDDGLAHAFGLDLAATQRELPLKQILRSVHPDDHDGLVEAINGAMASGGRYAHQYRTRNADGEYHWLEAIGRVDLNPTGQPLGFHGVLIDIDERRQVEAERNQAQALLRSFVEAAPGWCMPRTARAAC